jgi:hypothetical protein
MIIGIAITWMAYKKTQPIQRPRRREFVAAAFSGGRLRTAYREPLFVSKIACHPEGIRPGCQRNLILTNSTPTNCSSSRFLIADP